MNTILAQSTAINGDGARFVVALLLFVAAGAATVFGALMLGWFVRPKLPHPEKLATYECGEPTIGSGWIQFDLRFYVVALVFIIFDVEVALLFPWAVVYGGGANPGASLDVLRQVRTGALVDMLFFFGVIVVGFLYLWRYGYLDWVRFAGQSGATWMTPPEPPDRANAPAESGESIAES